MDFFILKGGCRDFQRSAAKWCRTKQSSSKIVDLLGLSGRDERPLAVMGVQDEAKGEALVAA